MKMEVVISKYNKANKTYDARIDGTTTVSFGQKLILNNYIVNLYKSICL